MQPEWQEGDRSAFKMFTGKHTEKRSSGRSKSRQKKNTRMDIKEMGNNVMNWVDSTQDRDNLRSFVNAALNLRVK